MSPSAKLRETAKLIYEILSSAAREWPGEGWRTEEIWGAINDPHTNFVLVHNAVRYLAKAGRISRVPAHLGHVGRPSKGWALRSR